MRDVDDDRNNHLVVFMELILIRHTSVAVPRGVCYGNSDVPLSGTFEEEAYEVRKKLHGYRFGRVYTSPLTRCVRLAEYCGYPEAIRDSRLKEMNFGEWEMKRFDEISDPRLQEWYDDYMNVAPTGGESSMSQKERFESFIRMLKRDFSGQETVAAFTHGGILIHALVRYCGKTYKEAFGTALPYGTILELDI